MACQVLRCVLTMHISCVSMSHLQGTSLEDNTAPAWIAVRADFLSVWNGYRGAKLFHDLSL